MEPFSDDRIPPMNIGKLQWAAIIATCIVAWSLTALFFYVLASYGMTLFIGLPLFMGFSTVILCGWFNKQSVSYSKSWQLGFITLGVYMAGLLLFAMEGLVCIVMCLPIALPLTWLGSAAGYYLINKRPGKAPGTLIILTCSIPFLSFAEKDAPPDLNAVVTSIEINASPETVWRHVVAFPKLQEPEEFIFKTGIAYPVDATITGTGVGAIRHCNFNTGKFVEPIRVWDQPRLLKFDVLEQPAPMKEISFWDIDAPHLHDYFVSKCGQFKLTALPNGNTLLEGTTWYYHNIRPAFYWRPWSNYIIHEIHGRVLRHIKKVAELN